MIEVTFTWAQYRNLQYDDAPMRGYRIRNTKTTVTFAAPREVWEDEISYAETLSSFGGQWVEGRSYSAGSAAGRIRRALDKAAQK